MSVDQSDSVDAIGVDNDTGQLVLTISDHLTWSDEGEHLLLLQEKLNTYLRFVEGGELVKVYPNAAGRSVVIDIVMKYEVDESGIAFLTRAAEIVRGAGMELRFGRI